MKIKEFVKSEKTLYIVVVLIATALFAGIYGVKVLNPCYTDWLMGGGDLTQHYLGWRAYRESAWHFPIGMSDTLAYPYQYSVIFTDSIPLFAVLFKLLSPILPGRFQYFGIWGLLCFILQGSLSVKILKKYTRNRLLLIIAAAAVILTPVMIWRMYTHTALAGQWVLLLGLDRLFNRNTYRDNKKGWYLIAGLAFFSASIHMFFVLMNGIILLGICILDILEEKKVIRSLLQLLEYLLAAAFVTWLLGGFNSGMTATAEGLKYYSANINTLVNPQGWSCILRDQPLYKWGQYEGFGYLGAGFLLLFLICFALWAGSGNVRSSIALRWKTMIAVALVFIISFAFALSPLVTIGDSVLFEMKIPEFVSALWSIFRASGRTIWICVYLVEFCIFSFLLKHGNKRLVISLLIIALLIQGYDIHKALLGKHEKFGTEVKYESLLTQENFWNEIAQDKELTHIVYYSTLSRPYLYAVTDWALDNNKTLNTFYFSRSMDDKVSEYKTKVFENAQDDIVYIFRDDEKLNCKKYDLHFYSVDDMIIGCKKAIEGGTEISDSDYRLEWIFSDDQYISENQYISGNGGKDTALGRELYPGGYSYGPYWSVPKGNFGITITGTDIAEEDKIIIYSAYGTDYHDFKEIDRSSDKIELRLLLDYDVPDLEIVFLNETDETVVLNSISLEYLGEN